MIKMDTDSVRSLAASVQHLADQLDTHFNSINASVISANWQSQAREEFVENLNIVVRAGSSSSATLRLMGTAVNRKVDQWDAIASVFNGPFYYLEGIWDNFINGLSNSWNNLLGTIGNIRWPSTSAITGISSAVIGGFVGLWPEWDFKKPDWPWNSKKENATGSVSEINKQGSISSGNTNVSSQIPNQETEVAIDHKIQYDGSVPAPGLTSSYGKPGQHPLNAPIQSDPKNRELNLYEDVINQFGVGNNPRYSSDDYTYCNTFAGDVARSMGVPFPKKSEFGMNPKDPATIGFPQLYDYFTNPQAPVNASDDGWRQVNSSDLQTLESHVNSGKMAIVVNNGHIAVIRPGQEITDFNSIRIAQAGAKNANDISLGAGFGNSDTPKIYIVD